MEPENKDYIFLLSFPDQISNAIVFRQKTTEIPTIKLTDRVFRLLSDIQKK